MHKFIVITMALLAISGGLALGCQRPATAPTGVSTLSPCSVSLDSVRTIFVGGESSLLYATLIFSNPNTFEVAVENVNYSISTPDFPGEMVKSYVSETHYIPAGKKIEVGIPILIIQQALVTNRMWQNIPAADAAAIIAPFWKSLGSGKGRLSIEGEAFITSEFGTSTLPLKLLNW